MNKKLIGAGFLALGLTLSTAVAFADDGQGQGNQEGDQRPMMGGMFGTRSRVAEGALGTVTAVSGTTLTIQGRDNETKTVDASNASITRVAGTQIQVSDIVVGDTILVQGQESDGAVVASRIVVGIPGAPMMQRDRTEAGQQEDGQSDDRRPPMMASSSVPQRFAGEKEGIIMGIGRAIGLFGGNRDNGNGSENGLATVIGGSITSIDASSFVLEVPARGDHATSTAVITTSASTTYVTSGASTGTSADLAVGKFATVQGIITATSTMTISAHRVSIGTTTSMMRGEGENGMNFFEEHASSSARIDFKSIMQNFFSRLGSFFHF